MLIRAFARAENRESGQERTTVTLCIMKSETFALGASDKTLGRLNVGGDVFLLRGRWVWIDSGARLKWRRRRTVSSPPIVCKYPSLCPLLDPNTVGELKEMQFVHCRNSVERNTKGETVTKCIHDPSDSIASTQYLDPPPPSICKTCCCFQYKTSAIKSFRSETTPVKDHKSLNCSSSS